MSWEAERTSAAETDPVALFHRTLAELCRSDVPLPKALAVLAADLERGGLKNAVEQMAEQIERGTPLAEAYGAQADVFPSTYRSLVAAGVEAGDLPAALDEIADHAARQADTDARLRRALAWPVLSALVILLIAGAALAFAMPQLWHYTDAIGASSPAPYAFAALGVLALFVVGAVWMASRRGPREGAWGLGLPVIGPIRGDALRATVASTVALGLRRRLPLPEALELAATTVAYPDVRARIEGSAALARDGATLSEVLNAMQLFDRGLLWLVKSAEGTQDVDRALDDVARFYRRRLDRRLDRFTLVVRPAAELVVGATVFAFAFSYLVPLFDWAGRILSY